MFCLLLLLSAPLRAQAPQVPQVMEIRVDGMIHPISAEFVMAGMEQAIRRRMDLILIQINTPGGLDSSMRQIIEKIINSPVPVAVYVAPSGSRAASAGFFILLSADIAAMAPGTNTGAAHPVFIGAGETDETMKAKVANDAAAYLRSIAGKRGRDVALAEKGVTESKSFTESEALEGKLIDMVAADRSELLQKLDGREITRFDGKKETLHLEAAQVEIYAPSFRQNFLSKILDPNIAFILLILGILGLYVEFSNPGLILPGVAGGIALILGLFALSLLPVNWAGAALILLAIVFFVLEAKFVTHGILAAGGVLSMVLGALMLINTRLPGGSITLVTALSVALPFAAITIFLLRLVIRAQAAKSVSGDVGMIGEIGKAETALVPEGKIFVHGELWDAASRIPVPAGAVVRVLAVEGLKLWVEPVSDSHPSPAQHEPRPEADQHASKGA
ncbi:MAG: serine protease [Acidobacteria bacterium RIFCSPLOWO2_02_FULL_59_13]|nr:MAG: serine protease [Acidobacteria bacterium RIFCSPLOWO2_02_FULL_59_13]